MKKLIALIVSVAMILSLSVLMVNAVERIGDNGKVLIEWDADAASKITFDGDISDWSANGYKYTTIGADNLFAWAGSVNPEFEINAYFVADSDYLYVAFFIKDSDWVKAGAYSSNAMHSRSLLTTTALWSTTSPRVLLTTVTTSPSSTPSHATTRATIWYS